MSCSSCKKNKGYVQKKTYNNYDRYGKYDIHNNNNNRYGKYEKHKNRPKYRENINTKYGKSHYNNYSKLPGVKGNVSKMDFAKSRAIARKSQETINNNYNNNNKDIIYMYLPEGTLRSWNTIHIKARNANTKNKKDEFVKYMKYLADHFPCPDCIGHIRNYINKNPIENYYDIKENEKDIGLFKWSWEFHNEVNKRLGKKIMSWEELSRIYI